MKTTPIALLIAASLTLGGCGTFDQLVDDARSWLNDARTNNSFDAVDENILEEIDDDRNDDRANRDAFRETDSGFAAERDSDEYLFEVVGTEQLAVGEIDRDDGRLYIEFEPNDAFIAVSPTAGGVNNDTITLDADPNFTATGDEFTMVLDRESGKATMTGPQGAVKLVATGTGSQMRITGVDLDGNTGSDVTLYSDDYRDGRHDDDDDDDDDYERDDDYGDYYDE